MPTSWQIMSASATASPQTYGHVQFGQGEWGEWDTANAAGVCAALCINWLLSDDKTKYAREIGDSHEGEQARKDANTLQTSLMAGGNRVANDERARKKLEEKFRVEQGRDDTLSWFHFKIKNDNRAEYAKRVAETMSQIETESGSLTGIQTEDGTLHAVALWNDGNDMIFFDPNGGFFFVKGDGGNGPKKGLTFNKWFSAELTKAVDHQWDRINLADILRVK
jgi:hypothetical protein